MECLKAIQTILDSIRKQPALYPPVEKVLIPLLKNAIDHEYIDYFEEIIRILTFLTFYGPVISQDVWSLFPLLVQAFHEWAYDFISNILIPMDNYISRATEEFLTSDKNYLEMVFQMYKRVLEDDKAPEQDAGEVCKLIEVVLQNCRGRVDSYIPPIVVLAVKRLLLARTSPFKVLLLEVIANSLYYNPELTLTIIEQNNFTQVVFTLWFQLVFKAFKRVHDKKITILGLSSILDVNWASLPAVIKAGFRQILQALVRLLQLIAEQKEKESQVVDEEEEEEEEEEEDSQEEVDDNEDVNDDFDLEQLADEASAFSPLKEIQPDSSSLGDHIGHSNDAHGEDGDEDEEDEDIDSDLVEVVEISSPIDSVHELVFFVQHFQGVSVRDNATCNHLVSLLSIEEQQVLQKLLEQAKSVEQSTDTKNVAQTQK